MAKGKKATKTTVKTNVEYSVEGLLSISVYITGKKGRDGELQVKEDILEACREALAELSVGGEANVDEYQSLDIEIS